MLYHRADAARRGYGCLHGIAAYMPPGLKIYKLVAGDGDGTHIFVRTRNAFSDTARGFGPADGVADPVAFDGSHEETSAGNF